MQRRRRANVVTCARADDTDRREACSIAGIDPASPRFTISQTTKGTSTRIVKFNADECQQTGVGPEVSLWRSYLQDSAATEFVSSG